MNNDALGLLALTVSSRNQCFRLSNGENTFNDSLIERNSALIKPSSSFTDAVILGEQLFI